MQNAGRYRGIRSRDLENWLRPAVRQLAPEFVSFCVRLTGADEIQTLNRLYRLQDKTTDVLSFPGGVSPEGKHLGDVVISVPMARTQAQGAGHDVMVELQRLILHGLLHCLGYDHESDDGAMLRLESKLRKRWIQRQ